MFRVGAISVLSLTPLGERPSDALLYRRIKLSSSTAMSMYADSPIYHIFWEMLM